MSIDKGCWIISLCLLICLFFGVISLRWNCTAIEPATCHMQLATDDDMFSKVSKKWGCSLVQ